MKALASTGTGTWAIHKNHTGDRINMVGNGGLKAQSLPNYWAHLSRLADPPWVARLVGDPLSLTLRLAGPEVALSNVPRGRETTRPRELLLLPPRHMPSRHLHTPG